MELPLHARCIPCEMWFLRVSVTELRWFLEPIAGSHMERINTAYFYKLASRLIPEERAIAGRLNLTGQQPGLAYANWECDNMAGMANFLKTVPWWVWPLLSLVFFAIDLIRNRANLGKEISFQKRKKRLG